MINGETVGLIIPCHNEAEGLRCLLPLVSKEVDNVLIVDNNSSDATAAVAEEFGAQVLFEPRPGYGQAYQAGFKAASTDIIVTLDGDGQYPVGEVPRLVKAFQQRHLDFLSAARFPLQASKMSVTRRFGNALLTLAANILFGKHIADTQSGMWVFRRTLLDTVKPNQAGMAFSEEFKIKILLAHLRFGEEHIPYHERIGVSKLLPLKDGWLNMLYLFQLWHEHRFS